VQAASFDYTPRHPEESLMYQVVAEQLETFLGGIKEFGFLRLHCDTCRKDRLLPFSCKGGRAFCPSCGGRRLADTAAHLVDRVIPDMSAHDR